MKRNEKIVTEQQYEGHLKRLTKLKRPLPNTYKSTSPKVKPLTKVSLSLPLKTARPKTDPLHHRQNNIAPINVKKSYRVPLSLVPQTQRDLVYRSLESKKVKNRQAELLLENYLLGRRILKTQSCIKNQEFKKDFRKHQRYMDLRSRGRQQEISLSQSRLQMLKALEYQGKSCEKKNVLGTGRLIFELHIKQLQTIVRQQEEGKLYNLLIKMGKKIYRYNNLTLQNLKNVHTFRFKKRHITSSSIMNVQLEVVIQNEIRKYANFSINLSNPTAELKQLPRFAPYSYHNNSQINGLQCAKNEKMMGTVLYDYWIKTTTDAQ